MNARGAWSLTVALGVLLAGLAPLPSPVVEGQEDPPNILLILTDDQRRTGTFSSLPAVRRWFRRRGASFPAAVANTPLCCPARASILTGQYAHNHGIRSNRGAHSLDHDATITRHLLDGGYRTAYVGKFLNGWAAADGGPPHFERWALTTGGHFGAKVNVDGAIRSLPRRRYTTDFIRDRAARLLGRFNRSPDPWFLMVSTPVPHRPLTPADRHASRRISRWQGNPAVRERDRSDKPPFLPMRDRSRPARKVRRLQLRMLFSVDDLVDRLMSELVADGAAEDTLVVYASDNGLMWGEHGLMGKNRPYLPTVEVPLLLRWPGTIPGRTVDRRKAALLDIAPTVLKAAGLPVPDSMDGRSLLGDDVRSRLLTEGWSSGGTPDWAATLTGRTHYIEYYDQQGTIIFREYYDLVHDPWELRNVLGDGRPGNDPPAAVVASLSTQLARDRRCEGTAGPDACP